MEESVKFCVVCGRRIPALSMRRRTCSDFCRGRKKSGYAPYINYDKPPFEDLTNLQKKAHEAGMSYGKYMSAVYNGKLRERG
ncbi:MAG: hypothetical protein E7392_02935 [Ruminococcaceae bacterium]|nr:hypothetical protein [Oscillospiraceae bacterium]